MRSNFHKSIYFIIAVLFITVSSVNAQEIQFVNYKAGDFTKTTSTQEKEGANINQIGDPATDWNYGSIKNASTGYRFFKFINTGQGPLVISAAKGSCGCTVPTWPKEPIMPGQSDFIKVKYDTKRTGAFTKYVTLTTNAKTNTTTRLKILGTVSAPPTTPKPEPANTPVKE
jgi:hypothetical protein